MEGAAHNVEAAVEATPVKTTHKAPVAEVMAAAEKPLERTPMAAVPQPKRSGRQARQVSAGDKVDDKMTIKELSERMGIRLVDVIKVAIRSGESPKTIQHELSLDIGELVVMEFDMTPQLPAGATSKVSQSSELLLTTEGVVQTRPVGALLISGNSLCCRF